MLKNNIWHLNDSEFEITNEDLKSTGKREENAITIF